MPSFLVPTPGDLIAQESPPREFAMQGQKNANARGSARGRGGGGVGWAQLELTDALQRRLPANWVWIRDILIEFTERFFSGYATSSSLNFFVNNNLKC